MPADVEHLVNPFQHETVTESIANPERFFELFAEDVLIQEAVQRTIVEPKNQFVVGPIGCGKTMLLQFLSYRHQMYISQRADILETYDPAVRNWIETSDPFVGIYCTFGLSPFKELRDSGFARPVMSAFSSFVNLVLCHKLIRCFRHIAEEDCTLWTDRVGVDRDLLVSNQKAVVTAILASLRSELALVDGGRDWAFRHICTGNPGDLQGLEQLLLDDLNAFHGLCAKLRLSESDFPNSYALPGRLIHALSETLRTTEVLSASTRLFFLLDEYHALYLSKDGHRQLLTPVLNSLLKSPREEGALVFYRVGTRKYALEEPATTVDDRDHLEMDREYTVLDLSTIYPPSSFRKFLMSVCRKRFKMSHLSEEVNIDGLLKRPAVWASLRDAIMSDEGGIRLSGELSKGLAMPQQRSCQHLIRELYARFHQSRPCCGSEKLDEELVRVIAAVHVIRWSSEDSSSIPFEDALRAVDRNEHRSTLREVALVSMCRIYDRKRRYFGFDTLVAAAYPVVNTFLRMADNIFAWSHARNPRDIVSISSATQDSAITHVSERMVEEIATKQAVRGYMMRQVVSRLSALFLDLQRLVPPLLALRFSVAPAVYRGLSASQRAILDEADDHYVLIKKCPKHDEGSYVFLLSAAYCPARGLALWDDYRRSLTLTREQLDALLVDRSEDAWSAAVAGILEDARRRAWEGFQERLDFGRPDARPEGR